MRNGTPFTVEKISPRAGHELGTARSASQRLAHRATGVPRRGRNGSSRYAELHVRLG